MYYFARKHKKISSEVQFNFFIYIEIFDENRANAKLCVMKDE